MPLEDRAESILARLIAEPALSMGSITFIAHSLGGLVVKAILRSADRDGSTDARAENLVSRLKGVAFLATPHQGSDQAGLYKTLSKLILLRATPVLMGLTRNNSALRSLNTWYRRFSEKKNHAHLVLRESKPVPFLGVIVKPDSADPGLNSNCIPADANHINITKPTSRDDPIYVLIKDFINLPRQSTGHDLGSIHRIENSIHEGFANLSRETDTINAGLEALQKSLSGSNLSQSSSVELINKAAHDRIINLRRSRFYGEIKQEPKARALSTAILGGELAGVSPSLKAEILGWCARFLVKNDAEAAKAIIKATEGLEEATEVKIAEAFRVGFYEDHAEAMRMLSIIDSPIARSAQLFLKDYDGGEKAVNDWQKIAELDHDDFDADGKFLLAHSLIKLGEHEEALRLIQKLRDSDFHEAPVLLRLAADAHLVMAVPFEARNVILRNYQADLRKIPFKATPEALRLRREASNYYLRSSRAARELGAIEFSKFDDDRHLWLRLRDPLTEKGARDELRESLADDSSFLRRIPMAVDFGISFDVERAERAADRQEARSGEVTVEIALARYYLALRQADPAAVADYIQRHRATICEVLAPEAILSVLIEMLARSGAKEAAHNALEELKEIGVDAEQERLLQQLVDGDFDDLGAIKVFRDRYQKSKSLDDLSKLVRALRDENDWADLVKFGRILFQKTEDINDASLFAEGMYNAGEIDDLIDFFIENESLIHQSNSLLSISAWADFRAGHFSSAESKCLTLLDEVGDENHRTLYVYICMYSGRWLDLTRFIENEWEQRNSRSPNELLRAAHLAQGSASPRLRDLVFEAARRGTDDPKVLLGCYQIAVESGWEGEEAVAKWMPQAVALSDEGGPIQLTTLKEVMSLQPGWASQRDQALQQLERAEIPYFAAAQMLNRSLVELILTTACHNQTQRDIRHKACIWAYTGAEDGGAHFDLSVLALEPISLLILQMSGMLSKVLSAAGKVVIPHSTLAWLFNERRRVRFHQPSRVVSARQLRALIASGKIEEFAPSVTPAPVLIREVGREIAEALTYAKGAKQAHGDTIFVVHPRPVYRAESMMEEIADIKEFEDVIVGCEAVVQRLRDSSVITQATATKALSYIKRHGATTSAQSTIPPGATVLLDGLAVSYLLQLNLLEYLKRAELRCLIVGSVVRDADALIAFDDKSAEVQQHIEALRGSLSGAIASGAVVVGPDDSSNGESEGNELSVHPSVKVVGLAEQATALIIDDRYFNAHRFVETSKATVPIFNTAQLVDHLEHIGLLSADISDEWRTSIRRSGIMYLVPAVDEVVRYVLAGSSDTGGFTETAELRAIKESLLKLRQMPGSRMPADLSWLTNTLAQLRSAIPKLWEQVDLSAEVAAHASTWLLQLIDPRDWAHVLSKASVEELSEMYAHYISTLILYAPIKRKKEYFDWLDTTVIQPLSIYDTQVYEVLINNCCNLAAKLSESLENSEQLSDA
mgnify:FL=1